MCTHLELECALLDFGFGLLAACENLNHTSKISAYFELGVESAFEAGADARDFFLGSIDEVAVGRGGVVGTFLFDCSVFISISSIGNDEI